VPLCGKASGGNPAFPQADGLGRVAAQATKDIPAMARVKITSQTDNRLLLDHSPWLLGLGAILAFVVMLGFTWRFFLAGDWYKTLIVGACAILAPGALFLVVTREQLVLDRDTGEVIHRARSLLYGFRKRRLPLAALREVQVRFIESHEEHTMLQKSYRAVLPLRARRWGTACPLPRRLGEEGDAYALKRVIDDWLARPDTP
jgi:hypothetical protein